MDETVFWEGGNGHYADDMGGFYENGEDASHA